MRLIHPALKISSAIAQMVGEQPQIEAVLSGDMYVVVLSVNTLKMSSYRDGNQSPY